MKNHRQSDERYCDPASLSKTPSYRSWWLGLACAILSAAPIFGQLSVAYADHGIAIAGAKPHGKIAVYGTSQYKDVVEFLVRDQGIVRADADGKVFFPVEKSAFRSVWVIVDLTDGEYLVSSPAGYRARRVPPPASGVANGDHIQNPRPVVEAFVARKGSGAWSGKAADRQRNGSSVVAVRSLRSLEREGPPPPQRLSVGDIVFAMDVTDMEFWIAKIGPDDIKGAADAK